MMIDVVCIRNDNELSDNCKLQWSMRLRLASDAFAFKLNRSCLSSLGETLMRCLYVAKGFCNLTNETNCTPITDF